MAWYQLLFGFTNTPPPSLPVLILRRNQGAILNLETELVIT